MENARIIIADSKENSRKLLRECLNRNGFQIQAEIRNAPDLLRRAKTMYPDLVVMDANIEGGGIFEIASIIQEDAIAEVLIIAGSESHRLKEYAHIIRPYASETLAAAVEICLLYNSRVNLMRKQVVNLQEDMRTRKLVDQAKGILMEKWNITEGEAYRSLQKESMNKGISLKDLARGVIDINNRKGEF